MTLIVGILCTDGVVVASDSAATFGTSALPTIGQQEVTKIHRLNESVLFSSTGAVGIAQLIAQEVRNAWQNNEFGNMKAPEEAMNLIGNKIVTTVTPYLGSANLSRPLIGECSASLCKSLVAMPVKRKPCLFHFDYNGAPEQVTTDLPFISLGKGQLIADPFLALLKRLLWKTSPPTLAEGRLVATWTLEHVRATNPGGVGGKSQLATLSSSGSKQPTVTMIKQSDIQEHLQKVSDAEKALVNEVRPSTEDGQAAKVPEAP